ncbi:hypothetical protein SNEBB_004651 [Seison nebaliae]|nr:hypothetical protein SNEBB_004651 [Seison nebaliae]
MAQTQLKNRFNEICNNILDNDTAFGRRMKQLEVQTGINRRHLLFGGIGLLSVYLVFGYGANFISNFIGTIYPAYMSIHAIESKPKDDDTKWLIYWVVFSMFVIIESVTSWFTSWLPLYWLTKCIFLIWCMTPGHAGGSSIIYYKIIKPLFVKHSNKIDKHLENAEDHIRDMRNQLLNCNGMSPNDKQNLLIYHRLANDKAGGDSIFDDNYGRIPLYRNGSGWSLKKRNRKVTSTTELNNWRNEKKWHGERSKSARNYGWKLE